MTAGTDPLFRLPAKSLEILLGELCRLRDRIRSGEKLTSPEITLHLESGQALRGEVIGVENLDAIADSTLLIRNSGSDRTLDVTYIPVTRIYGLRIHHTPDTLHLLSFGKIKPHSGKVPSRLELERQLRSLSVQFHLEPYPDLSCTIVWDSLPNTDETYQSLGQLLTDLELVLSEINGDEMGRIAFHQQVQRLEIQAESVARVMLQRQILQIQVKVEAGDIEFQSKQELKQAIEGFL